MRLRRLPLALAARSSRRAVLGSLFAAAVLAATPAVAQTNVLTHTVDEMSSLAVIPSPGLFLLGQGSAELVLDSSTGAFTLTGSYSSLSGQATSASLRVAPGFANGPEIVSIAVSGGVDGTLSASGVLSPANVQDVLTRNTYVIVYSTFAPGGEIRGQVDFAQQSEAYNGTGINPPGSLTGGGAILNGDIDLVLDNPLNSMAPGTLGFLYYSFAPDSVVGVGAGMADQSAEGELLLQAPFFSVGLLDLWNGPADPATFSIDVPFDPSLVGLEFFMQGLLVDLNGSQPGAHFGFSNGLRLVVGNSGV